MKFGKQLLESAHPAWHDQYVDYKALKQLLKQITPTPHGQMQSERDAEVEGAFMSALLIQIQKVNHFFLSKAADLSTRLCNVTSSLSTAAQSLPPCDVDNVQPLAALSRLVYDHRVPQNLRTALYTFTSLCLEVDALRKFSILNYFAVSKVVKKHDKLSPVQLRSTLGIFVTEQPFYTSTELASTFAKMQVMIQQLLRGARTSLVRTCSRCSEMASLLVVSGGRRMCHACLATESQHAGDVDPASVSVTPLLGDPQNLDGSSSIVTSDDKKTEASSDEAGSDFVDSSAPSFRRAATSASGVGETMSLSFGEARWAVPPAEQSKPPPPAPHRKEEGHSPQRAAQPTEELFPSAFELQSADFFNDLQPFEDAPAALELVANVATMPDQLKASENMFSPTVFVGNPRAPLEMYRSPLNLAEEIRATEIALGSTFGRSTDSQLPFRPPSVPPPAAAPPHYFAAPPPVGEARAPKQQKQTHAPPPFAGAAGGADPMPMSDGLVRGALSSLGCGGYEQVRGLALQQMGAAMGGIPHEPREPSELPGHLPQGGEADADRKPKKWACRDCHKAKAACEGEPCRRCVRLGKTCVAQERQPRRRKPHGMGMSAEPGSAFPDYRGPGLSVPDG